MNESVNMLQLLMPVLILQLILMATALVSCLKQKETNGPKWLWIIVIIFLNIIGPILYFIFGRKER